MRYAKLQRTQLENMCTLYDFNFALLFIIILNSSGTSDLKKATKCTFSIVILIHLPCY
jgi:hypothetical protein